MQIKCGSCGKDIIVPDDLVVGQHVRCPYCNEKSAFDKPSRVVLPTEIRPILQREVVDLPFANNKPKLAVRRPAQTPKDREHLNVAAAAVDARIRMADRKRKIAQLKKSLGNLVSVLALIVLVLIGFIVWKAIQKKEVPVRLPEQVAQLFSNTIEKVSKEIE